MNQLNTIRPLADGEEIEVCNLVARSFNEFIAPEFSEEGVEEFFKYANPRALKKRNELGYLAMVSEIDGNLVGMIETRGSSHISMLYVDKLYHRRGVAKGLIKEAIKSLDLSPEITVNSSRYAVPFYESLGFIQFENEKTIYGVIHIPMMVAYTKLKERIYENTP